MTMGVAWASGINLYAAVFMLGFMGNQGYMDLPPGLEVLENDIVLSVAFLMYFVEFFMDKVPGVDSGWDTLHTFIRVPAGAILAAQTVGDVDPVMHVVAGLMGGGITASSHAAKAGSRVLINTSPEPFTNWGASVAEDLAVIGGLWAALQHPWIFLILFIAWIALLVWVLPKIWRGVRKAFRWLARLIGGQPDSAPRDDLPPTEPAPDPDALSLPIPPSKPTNKGD
ncbi:MAG: DUF4126 domain-containing protein [Gammaproteobacteria bacterium]